MKCEETTSKGDNYTSHLTCDVIEWQFHHFLSSMLKKLSLASFRHSPSCFITTTSSKLSLVGFTVGIGRQLSAAAESNKVVEGREARNGTSAAAAAASSTPDATAPTDATADAVHSELHKVLRDENKKLTEDNKKIKDKYLLALAETENVRMRMNKQIYDAKLFSIQGFCRDLLEVADILSKATESVPEEELERNNHLKSLFEGLILTEHQLQKVFQKHAIEQIKPIEGDKFDPYLHEAMFEVSRDGKEPGTVADTIKLGYRLHNRTVRPAVVGVYKTL